ncbi:MAG: low molecular weight protein-tyrosine-phosphatase [Oscillospiraceae bacterium]
MIRILFVCHGNICRSPMAEFVMKHMVSKRGLADEFTIASAATSTEEIGNDTHRGTRERLRQAGVPFTRRAAVQLTRRNYDHYDYLIGMDSRNITNMLRIIGHDRDSKVRRLLDFTQRPRDIADPWYSDNFDLTYDDIVAGCEALLEYILQHSVQK